MYDESRDGFGGASEAGGGSLTPDPSLAPVVGVPPGPLLGGGLEGAVAMELLLLFAPPEETLPVLIENGDVFPVTGGLVFESVFVSPPAPPTPLSALSFPEVLAFVFESA